MRMSSREAGEGRGEGISRSTGQPKNPMYDILRSDANYKIDQAHRRHSHSGEGREEGRSEKARDLWKQETRKLIDEREEFDRNGRISENANAEQSLHEHIENGYRQTRETYSKRRMRSSTRENKLSILDDMYNRLPESSRTRDTSFESSTQPFREQTEKHSVSEEYETEQIKAFCTKKEIRPLSQTEIQQKNDYFDQRYNVNFEPHGKDGYKLKISLKRGGESFYDNSVNFARKELAGEYNYPSHDKEDRFDKGRMPLSDIKYQTWRRAIEHFKEQQPERAKELGIDETTRPSLLSGGDVEEASVMKAVYSEMKLPMGSEIHRIETADERFDTMMATKIGKSNLFLLRNYFPDLAVSHLEIQTGNRSKYVGSTEYHLMSRDQIELQGY
jgi:hypothetical protein